MPRRGQVVPIWDGKGGIDTGGDPHQGPRLIIAENIEQDRRAVWQKRNGSVSTAMDDLDSDRIDMTTKGPLIASPSSARFWDASSSDQYELLSPDGDGVISLTADHQTLGVLGRGAGRGKGEWFGDIHDNGSNWVFVYGEKSSGGVTTTRLGCVDKSTGVALESVDLGDSTASYPALARIVPFDGGDTAICYYYDDGYIKRYPITKDTEVAGQSWDYVAQSVPSISGQWFDVCVVNAGGATEYALMVYEDSLSRLACVVLTEGTSVGFGHTLESSGYGSACVWQIDGDVGGVAWWATNGTNWEIKCIGIECSTDTLGAISLASGASYAKSGATITGGPVAISGQGYVSGSLTTPSTILFSIEYATATPPQSIAYSLVYHDSGGGTGAIADEEARIGNVAIATTPIRLPSQSAADFVYGIRSDKPDTLLFVTQDLQCVAILRRGSVNHEQNELVQRALSSGDGFAVLVRSIFDLYEGGGNDEVLQMEVVSVEESTARQVAEVAQQVISGGACPRQNSGGMMVSQGFLLEPGDVTFKADSAGGGMATNGSVYRIVFVLETTLADGRRVQSSPTLTPYEHTPSDGAGTDGLIELYVAVPSIVGHDVDDVSLVTYRTGPDGSTYYRDTLIKLGSDPGFPFRTCFAGVTAEADLEANEILYTSGGTLSTAPPRPYGVATEHQRRLFFVPYEKPDSAVGYSREIVDAEAPAHNSQLELAIPSEGGDIKALISHLDVLVAFKRDIVYAVEGEGPNDAGYGQTFRRARIISQGAGCEELRSLVRIPQGWVFYGQGTIWLLDMGMQVQEIGRPAKYYLDTYGPVVQACALYGQRKVMFGLGTSVSGIDQVLVLDYLHMSWSHHSVVNGTAGLVADDDTVYRLDDQGLLWTDTEGAYLDNLADVPLHIRSGWISPAGPMGRFRLKEVLVTGYKRSTASLQLQVAYDHDPDFVDAESIDLTDLDTYGFDEAYGAMSTTREDTATTLRFTNLSHQKCSAFLVDIAETSATYGASFAVSGIYALVAPLQGSKRVGADQED